MPEEILSHVYRIEIPLPNNPLKALNSYLIEGQERFLLVDTGMNREECIRAMEAALEDLGVDLRKTDLFITHLHADHSGLVGHLATDLSNVYIGEREAAIMNYEMSSEERWENYGTIYRSHGFPEDELEKAMANHPGRRYRATRFVDYHTLKDGDILDFGFYSFRCIETPGHSPGHMCLYEPDKKILISGDHILSKITPNITSWPEMDNSLKEYLGSLDKVEGLDVTLVLPGHRNIFDNHKERISELYKHHQTRLSEVLAGLQGGEKTAFQIAPHISWDIDYSSWELFPPSQKWFAVGETIAHIRYLESTEEVRRQTRNGTIVYSLT